MMTMTTRRYGDDEVQEIFRLATEGERRDPSLPVDPGGLRLAELQRIGQEAGIEPERVAAAAAALAARGRPLPVQRAFGLPIGIARVVDLPRAPTDREWEQLVAQCRTTFAVQGQATIEGGLRTWSHGNLHLSIEPPPAPAVNCWRSAGPGPSKRMQAPMVSECRAACTTCRWNS